MSNALTQQHSSIEPLLSAAHLDSMLALSERLVDSGLLPDSVKSPGAALAIILAGSELGLPPMASLRLVHVVKGRVVLDSGAQLALLHRAGFSSTWKTTTSDKATLELKHEDGVPQSISYTIEDAKRAGLAGKDNWRKHPAAMLRARCVSAAAKAIAPEVLAGVYTPDEAEEAWPDSAPAVVVEPSDPPNYGSALVHAIQQRTGGALPLDPAQPAPGLFAEDRPGLSRESFTPPQPTASLARGVESALSSKGLTPAAVNAVRARHTKNGSPLPPLEALEPSQQWDWLEWLLSATGAKTLEAIHQEMGA